MKEYGTKQHTATKTVSKGNKTLPVLTRVGFIGQDAE